MTIVCPADADGKISSVLRQRHSQKPNVPDLTAFGEFSQPQVKAGKRNERVDRLLRSQYKIALMFLI